MVIRLTCLGHPSPSLRCAAGICVFQRRSKLHFPQCKSSCQRAVTLLAVNILQTTHINPKYECVFSPSAKHNSVSDVAHSMTASFVPFTLSHSQTGLSTSLWKVFACPFLSLSWAAKAHQDLLHRCVWHWGEVSAENHLGTMQARMQRGPQEKSSGTVAFYIRE